MSKRLVRKTLRVTLDIQVEDLDAEERRECAALEGVPARDLPRLNDASPEGLAEVIVGAVECGSEEFFGGSGIYAKFTDATVLSAEFASLPTSEPKESGDE